MSAVSKHKIVDKDGIVWFKNPWPDDVCWQQMDYYWRIYNAAKEWVSIQ